MEKILLLTGEDTECLELISLIAEGEYDFRTIEITDPQKVIEAIDKWADELVGVFNCFHTSDILASNIYYHNHSTRRAPYIHILNLKQIDPERYKDYFAQNAYNFLIPREKVHSEIHSILSKIESRYDLEKNVTKPISKDGKKLYRMKISRFLSIDKAKNDVYIKIGAGKYIKIFLANTDIDKEKIKEYIEKGEKFLYQSEEDYMKTVSNTMNKLVKAFNDQSLSKAQKIGLQLTSIKEVQDVVRNMGITNDVIATTDELVKSVEQMLKSNKNLGPMVKKLLALKSRFFTRTSINNYLLGAMATKLGWESHQTLKKLIYASVFCDFSFEASDAHLSEVLSLNGEEAKKLSKVQQLRIKSHPKLSAAIMEKSDRMLTDEVNIIMHHHEKPDGSGFPSGLDYKTIPSLSCAFILAYDFTTRLIQNSDSADDLDPQIILDSLGIEYTKANFNKPYLALKEVLGL